MSAKNIFYGVNASQTQVLINNTFYVISILCIYGLWVDFIPSSVWKLYGFALSIVMAVGFMSFHVWALITKRASLYGKPSLVVKLSLLTVWPLMIWFFIWCGLVHGLGSVFTQIFGNRVELPINVVKERHYSWRSCDYRLKGDVVEDAMPPYICISENEFKEFFNKTIISIQGRRSSLGLNVEGYNR